MTFCVGTFNLRLGIADDGPHSWPNRRQLVAMRIAEADPDILGVQEAYDFQMDYLSQALRDHMALGVGREDGHRAGEFAAIFVRKSLFAIRDSGTFWLSKTPAVPNSMDWDTACTRICTWASLGSVAGGLWVYNTHLDHASIRARIEGTRLILDRAAAHDEPSILMGDLNAEPRDAPICEIAAAGFRDADAAANRGTWHDFTGQTSSRIDYVFAKGALSAKRVWVDERPGPDGLFPSDHFPVWVEFDMG